MTFGFDPLDPTGFNNPTFDELVLDGQAKFLAETGVEIDLTLKTPDLGFLRSLARMFKGAYDDQAGTYGAAYIATASGVALRNLLFPLIGDPLAASSSRVSVTLIGTPATPIGAGSSITLDPDGVSALAWVIVAPVVIGGGGTVVAEFDYSVTGPKAAAQGSPWSIATPIVGWTSVGPNPLDAVPGRDAETDSEYRIRGLLSALGRRLVASVSAVAGVTAVSIFENQTDIPDPEWGATHWIELLVLGGADADIAAAIQANRCFTNQTLGSTSFVTPALGFPGGTVLIRFSRPDLVDVWVDLTIIKGEGYSADTSAGAITAREDAIKAQIVAFGDARPVGLDVTAFQLAAVAAATPTVGGIGNIFPQFVGLAPAPTGDEVIAGPRDLLVFDAANITLTGV